MARYCVIGKRGFLGSALSKKLGGDVDYFPKKDTKVVFHFDSPVHPIFEENPAYHLNRIISDFLFLLPYCRDNGIFFIYPSSALVYEKDTEFTRYKKLTELMGSYYPNTLGLRIFPVYGPGENRTAITQWCNAMQKGERPVVYGDGTQKRDFIYIDDAVEQMIDLMQRRVTGVRDIGAGKPISFNQIVKTINGVLGTKIEPKYIPAPVDYSKGIVCKDPLLTKYSLEYGIKRILEQSV